MKIEVGMYVRYKNGKIIKANNVSKRDNPLFDYNINGGLYCSRDIKIEPSHDIIDLIEVGDYVNGHQVYEVDRECNRITLNGGDNGEEFRLTYD